MNYRFLAGTDEESAKSHAVHGSDLIPTSFSHKMDFQALLCDVFGPKASVVKKAILPVLLTSHALYSNPNPGARNGAARVPWPVANTSEEGNYVQHVMEPYLLPGLIKVSHLHVLGSAWLRVISLILVTFAPSGTGGFGTYEHPERISA